MLHGMVSVGFFEEAQTTIIYLMNKFNIISFGEWLILSTHVYILIVVWCLPQTQLCSLSFGL